MIELGIIIVVFLTWQFVVGKYLGGLWLIFFMWLVVKLTLPKKLEETVREHAREEAGEEEEKDICGWKKLICSVVFPVLCIQELEVLLPIAGPFPLTNTQRNVSDMLFHALQRSLSVWRSHAGPSVGASPAVFPGSSIRIVNRRGEPTPFNTCSSLTIIGKDTSHTQNQSGIIIIASWDIKNS